MAIYGIDLGTTNCCIAKLDRNGNPEVIRNQIDGCDTLASAAFFESVDNIIVGQAAKDMVETDSDRVIQYVKRDIGDIGNGKELPTYVFNGKEYNAVTVSALYLERLKQMVEEQGMEPIEGVVITCPAYFGLEERRVTKKAGEAANLNVLNLINEPTAAALSYCARQFQEEKTILVYDLGGGTFDVTIIKMSMVENEEGQEEQRIEVVATDGNPILGGVDWDNALFDHILEACCDEMGLSKDEVDMETRQLIRSRTEATKKKLTNSEKAKVKLSVSGTPFSMEITREKFEELTSDLVLKTMGYVENVLKEAGDIEIDMVLLVGGSTYMPMIRSAVEARFPDKVQIYEPDRAVAMGAAIYANMLVVEIEKGEGKKVTEDTEETGEDDQKTEEGNRSIGIGNGPTGPVVDKLPRSFGPGVMDLSGEYIIDNILKKGDEMPAERVKTYYTQDDNQQKIVLRVFENMSQEDSVTPCLTIEGEEQYTKPEDQVKSLGLLEMELPPLTPKSSPIEVTFRVDGRGVYVKAVNVQTGEKVETTIEWKNLQKIDISVLKGVTISGE